MTATRKIFFAAALVAAGIGLAKLVGEPAAASRTLQSAGALLKNQLAVSRGTSQSSNPLHANDSVRLVPDFSATACPQAKHNLPLIDVAPPLLSTENRAAGAATLTENANAASGPGKWSSAPRAKLRNEAPRPLAIEAHRPSAWEQPPAAASMEHTADTITPRVEQSPAFAPTIVASYNAVSDPTGTTPIAPPPWPAPEADESPRTHVIVDGDSLARLAGLYLDDPRRSGEIFEANRRVISDPDLLPIGVELVIPSRIKPAAVDDRLPQSVLPRAVAIHASATGGLVPVRPVPATPAIVPRAQLSYPMPVE